jgi:hypothetical protein
MPDADLDHAADARIGAAYGSAASAAWISAASTTRSSTDGRRYAVAEREDGFYPARR